jgi:hypothetical protein
MLRFEEWQKSCQDQFTTDLSLAPVISAILEHRNARNDLLDLVNEAYMDLSPFSAGIIRNEARQLYSRDTLKYALNLAVIDNDWAHALRLIALRAISGKPLSRDELRAVTEELRMEFGEDIGEALFDLDKVGLLSTRESQFKLPEFSPEELFPKFEETDEIPPEISLVEGFVWPSTLIVKKIVNGEWEWLRKVKGLKFDLKEKQGLAVARQAKRVFVFFVGGVTLSEVSQFRKFGRGRFWGCEYIVGATDLIQPGRFMSQFIPALRK